MHRTAILLLLLLAAPSAARAAGISAAEEAACTPDALRLCMAAIPDRANVAKCMIAHQAELGAACKAVFVRHAPKHRTRLARKPAAHMPVPVPRHSIAPHVAIIPGEEARSAVSNHEPPVVAPSFETRPAAAPQDEGWDNGLPRGEEPPQGRSRPSSTGYGGVSNHEQQTPAPRADQTPTPHGEERSEAPRLEPSAPKGHPMLQGLKDLWAALSWSTLILIVLFLWFAWKHGLPAALALVRAAAKKISGLWGSGVADLKGAQLDLARAVGTHGGEIALLKSGLTGAHADLEQTQSFLGGAVSRQASEIETLKSAMTAVQADIAAIRNRIGVPNQTPGAPGAVV